MKMLIIDDAKTRRTFLTSIAQELAFATAEAGDGREALNLLVRNDPRDPFDVALVDWEMPRMNGVEFVAAVRHNRDFAALKLMMITTQNSMERVSQALEAGADDYVTKPANVGSVTESMQRLESELIPKIKALCPQFAAAEKKIEIPITPHRKAAAPLIARRPAPVDIVCLGTSTGGPYALAEVFGNMPGDLSVPFVIVQHMPPLFTAMLAERLTAHSTIPCHEVVEGRREGR